MDTVLEETRLGRPPIGAERMVLDSYSIDPELLQRLRVAGKVTIEKGVSIGKSELIRRGIRLILKQVALEELERQLSQGDDLEPGRADRVSGAVDTGS